MNERLNIRRMQMPEKSEKEDTPFDPANDILPRQLNALREILPEVDTFGYATYAVALKVFTAEGDEPFVLDETRWKSMETLLSKCRGDSTGRKFGFDRFMHLATLMKILAPERQFIERSDYDLLKRGESASEWRGSMEYALAMKVLFPDKYQPPPPRMYEDAIQGMMELQQHAPTWWVAHAQGACAIRMLYPDNGIAISERHWKDIHAMLDMLWEHEDLRQFALIATNARILGAKEVRFDREGLKLSPFQRDMNEKGVAMPHSLEL